MSNRPVEVPRLCVGICTIEYMRTDYISLSALFYIVYAVGLTEQDMQKPQVGSILNPLMRTKYHIIVNQT